MVPVESLGSDGIHQCRSVRSIKSLAGIVPAVLAGGYWRALETDQHCCYYTAIKIVLRVGDWLTFHQQPNGPGP